MARAPAKRRSESLSQSAEDEDSQGTQGRRLNEIKRVKKERREAPGSPSSSAAEDEGEDESGNAANVEDDDFLADSEEEVDMDELIGSDDPLAVWEVIQNRKKGAYNNFIPEAGIIKSVHLVDFMCHRHLSMEFGPKMSFVVGHNGSGKSAVLTAITIALGGKASITGRGSGLKDLIRTGCDKATISVVFTNSGSEAYRPDVFDPYVVVERTITRSGAAPFKFRATRDGKIIASKKEELAAILQTFSIVVDSPLTILTQDQARSFLQASDPRKLYEFFLNGTQLASLALMYKDTESNRLILQALTARQRLALPDLKADEDRLARLLQSSRQLVELRIRYDDISKEIAWAYVSQKERERDAEAKKVDDLVSKLEQIRENELEEQTTFDGIAPQIAAIQAESERMEENRVPIKHKLEGQTKKLHQGQKDLADIENNIREAEAQMKEAESEVKDLERRIQAKAKANKQEEDPADVAAREKVQRLQRLLEQLTREKPKCEEEYAKAKAAREAIGNDISTSDEKVSYAEQQLSEAKAKLANLQSQSTDRLSAFGERMEMVMREINKAHWQHSKPIGPLGMHVKLNDSRYQAALHSVLGQTLCQFAVRCDADRSTMMRILQECHKRGYRAGYVARHQRNNANVGPPGVIQHAGDIFDYSDGDLSRFADTILSKLTITDEAVLRILINAQNIERTCVWPIVSGDNGVMWEIRRLIKQQGLRQCQFITADGFRANGSMGSESSGPLPTWQGNMLLSKDRDTDIESVKQEIVECQQRVDALRAEHSSLLARRNECDGALGNAMARLKKVRDHISPTQMQLHAAEAKLAEKPMDDFGAFESAHEDAVARYRGAEEQIKALREEADTWRGRLEDLSKKVQEIQEEYDNLQPACDNAKLALKKLGEKRHKGKTAIEYWTKYRARIEGEHKEAEAVLQQLQAEADQYIGYAREFSEERIVTNRDPKALEQKRKAQEQAIKDAQQQNGTAVEELLPRHAQAQMRYKQAEQQVEELEQLAKFLGTIIEQRQKFWREARSTKALLAYCSFGMNMSKRDLTGALRFNHDIGELHIEVQETGSATQNGMQAGRASGAKARYKTVQTMSGGERSFTTVSLLLSLWEVGESPLRCLDEWDVFLDHVNRQVAAKMLLEGVQDSHGAQYILITPQDMSGISTAGPGNRVIKMADPIRNQGTLPFQPAT